MKNGAQLGSASERAGKASDSLTGRCGAAVNPRFLWLFSGLLLLVGALSADSIGFEVEEGFDLGPVAFEEIDLATSDIVELEIVKGDEDHGQVLSIRSSEGSGQMRLPLADADRREWLRSFDVSATGLEKEWVSLGRYRLNFPAARYGAVWKHVTLEPLTSKGLEELEVRVDDKPVGTIPVLRAGDIIFSPGFGEIHLDNLVWETVVERGPSIGPIKRVPYPVTPKGPSGVYREVWLGVGSSRLDRLIDDPQFPGNPTFADVLPHFEAPTNWANNYGTRLRALVRVPISGHYTFWIAGDDQSELWFGRGEQPKALIASVPSWSGSRQWDKFPSQKSSSISMNVGEEYYLEALQKEGGGGDNLAVAWQGVGVPDRQIITGNFLSPTGEAPPFDGNPEFVVNAGRDQYVYLPRRNTLLNGSMFDLGGLDQEPVVEWRSVGLGGAQIELPNQLETGLWLPGFGEFEFELRAIGETRIFSDRVKVTVYPELGDDVGGLTREAWLGIKGRSVDSLFEDLRYPTYPDSVDQLPSFEGPIDWSDRFGSRIRGFLRVPVEGDYTFWASGNESALLSLSSSDDPELAEPIALVPRSTRFHQLDKFAEQQSAGQRLVPGVRYYVELAFKDEWGSDHVSVFWKGPLHARPVLLGGEFLAPFEPSDPFDPEATLIALAGRDRTLHSPRRAVELRGGFRYVRACEETPTFQWRQVTGPGDVIFADAHLAETRVTFPAEGDYVLELEASDSEQSAVDRLRIEVVAALDAEVGGVTREVWLDVQGKEVSDLIDSDAFASTAPIMDLMPSMELPSNWNDDYGTRLRGFLVAPVTGEYQFWIAGDDHCELWLSPDEDPSRVQRIAYLDSWVRQDDFDRREEQRSERLFLEAGQRYYLEALSKESRGADYFAVAWRGAGIPDREILDGSYLIPYLPAPPHVGEIEILLGEVEPIYWPHAEIEVKARVFDLESGPEELRVEWTGPSGIAGVSFFEPNQLETVATLPGPGVFTLRLTASDGLNTRLAELTVTVLDPLANDVGGVTREVWLDIPGSQLSRLRDHDHFPLNPFFRDQLPSLATPVNWGDKFGVRLRGYLYPPETGDYTFWLAGDDESELYLSTDESPSNRVMIAHVRGWTGVEQWDRYPEQESESVSLVQGQRYYIEILNKEGWGGDHVEVAWQGAGVSERAIINGGFLAPFESAPSIIPAQSLYVDAGRDQRHFLPLDAVDLGGRFAYVRAEDDRVPSFDWRYVSGPGPENVAFDVTQGLTTRVRLAVAGTYEFELRGRDGVDEHADRVLIQLGEPLAPDTGSVLRELWFGVSGRTVEALLESPRYPENPSIRDAIPRFEAPLDWSSNYGVRYRGYLNVPEAGDYSFYLSSDDYSVLRLSDSESPTGAVEVAHVNSWNRPRDWWRKEHQNSGPIFLEGGQRYYLEAWHKEGGGSDHFAVAWTGPGKPEPTVIEGGYLSPFEPAPLFDGQIQLLTTSDQELVWPESEVSLYGVAFDLVKGPNSLVYSWRLLSGGQASLATPNAQSCLARFETPGNYTIRFQVSDGVHTAHRDVNIAIVPPAGNGGSGLLREVWLDVGGVGLEDLVSHDRFPDQPNFVDQLSDFETPRNWADDYGTRIRGYFFPPETGTYYLWLSGDDHSELLFGSDGTEADLERIAFIEGWTRYRQWDRYPSQRSGPLNLVVGRPYYLEVRHKERRGDDHVEIGMSRSSEGGVEIIPAGRLVPFAPAPPVEEEILVVAGPDIGLAWPDRVVVLDGLVNDLHPGPFQLLVKWSEVGQTGVVLTRDNASATTAVFPGPGSYVLRLEGDDGLHVRHDELNVVIRPPVSSKAGVVVREVFEDISGSRLHHLFDAEKFPDLPDQRDVLTSLETPVNWLNNYGTRIRGFLHPAETGSYHFWLSGDDQSELWLSENDSPDGIRRIAHVPSWSQWRQFDRFPEQASNPIDLLEGTAYYFEIVHKEGGGGDHLSVAWQGPGFAEPQIISSAFLSPFAPLGDLESPTIDLAGASQMTLELGSVYVEPGFSATDNVDGDLTEEVRIIGAVDPSQPGHYALAYFVHDASGNAADPAYRNIEVVRLAGQGTSPVWPPGPPPGFIPPPPSDWNPPADLSEADAARFLLQASFGPSSETISTLREQGLNTWIEEQIALPPSFHVPHLRETMALLSQDLYLGDAGASDPMPRRAEVNDRMYTWWTHAIEAPDQLRQRMAFALSEILVVSDRSPALRNHTFPVTNYYDILVRHALGNYRDLMEDVSLSPVMGIYLTALRNTKADPETGVMPDENYARELLQLFTIGLNWLNPDGTEQTDSAGTSIPTYGMDEILSFARVFTGWTLNGSHNFFWASNDRADLMNPMMAFEEWHDTEPKVLLGGVELPAHQTAYQDLSAALDNIFHHPNVGPFLARALIQRLVTSNPSPAYVYRVAAAFDNNGQGERGDLAAVAQAIFLDPEARNPALTSDPHIGKLKEPILRLTHLIRAFYQFQSDSPPTLGRFGLGTQVNEPLGQAPLYAPSVFNFFDRDYSPSGPVQDAGLVAPEFQINSEVKAIDGANYFHTGVNRGFSTRSGFVEWVALNLVEAVEEASDPDGLLAYLDVVLMGGEMSPEVRAILTDMLSDLGDDPVFRAKAAVQIIITSPQFVIQR